ncbi:glutathione S-transferase T3-like [Rutidosis leptorrhynchoides]|uniref:glutathione S-transferase T3-like n=1 Tax=Rutidosis leptorrhynchoides TaxID=125765 RepID=UPI003A99AE27
MSNTPNTPITPRNQDHEEPATPLSNTRPFSNLLAFGRANQPGIANQPILTPSKEVEEPTKKNARGWSQKELLWLAECFCDTSKNPIVGKSQKRGSFWGRAMEKFNNNEFGWARNEDSMSSKWRDLNKSCSEFLPIYQDIKDHWRSGANDDDVYQNVLQAYYDRYTKNFINKDAFFFLKEHPKWIIPNDPVARAQAQGEGETGYRMDMTGIGESQGDPGTRAFL